MLRPAPVLACVALALLAVGPTGAGQAPAAAAQEKPAPQAAEAATAGKAHVEIPDTEGATCVQCHEDIAKKPVAHAPAEAGMCTACHDFSGKGEDTKVAFVGGAAKDNTAPLCVTCHDTIGAALKATQAHTPAASGDCVFCHGPHGGEQPRLLKSSQAELCAGCHDGVGEELKKASVHAPAAAECGLCHNPHGSPNATLLREVPNALCLACHSLPKPLPGGPAQEPGPVALGKDYTAPASALATRKQITLDRLGRGHPVARHPTTGPSDPTHKDRPFTCVSCHAPHGSATARLIAFELKPGEVACQKCHET